MNEPIAYINVEERSLEWAKPMSWNTPTVVKMDKVPLYTKKEWVGLTTDEVFELASTRLPHGLFASLIEAKLKEKNT
jgi:hypothetical protein